jgi:hypothetical protein
MIRLMKGERMRRLLALSIVVSLLGLPMCVGCEREISHEKSEEIKSDGTRVTEEKKVTQDTQTGEVTKTEEKTVDKPPKP